MKLFYTFESLSEDQQEKLQGIFPDIGEGFVVSGLVLYQYAPPHRPPSPEWEPKIKPEQVIPFLNGEIGVGDLD